MAMKFFVLLTGLVLLSAGSAAAQVNSENALAPESLDYGHSSTILAANLPEPLPSAAATFIALPPPAADPLPPSEPAPQSVAGVFPSYRWQAYVGYTFVRFYAYPGTAVNRNGFDLAAAYYFHQGWLGAEGALTTTFGSLSGQTSNFLLVVGGPKVRWSGPRAVDLWAHALAGGAHFAPQTPYGGEGAFGYELGAGVDVNAHHQHLAYRLEGDMVGTHFFGTWQYGPKISAGIVLKF
jgi:hypothetical protein